MPSVEGAVFLEEKVQVSKSLGRYFSLCGPSVLHVFVHELSTSASFLSTLSIVSTVLKALVDRPYTYISEVLMAGRWLSFIYVFQRIRWKSGPYMFMTGRIFCMFVYLYIIFHIVYHFSFLIWFSLGHTSISNIWQHSLLWYFCRSNVGMTTLLMSEHCWSLQNVRGKFMVLFAPSHILLRPQMFGPIISLSYSVTFSGAFFFYLAFMIIGVCLNSYTSPTWKNTLLIAASLAHRPIYMLQDLKPILKCYNFFSQPCIKYLGQYISLLSLKLVSVFMMPQDIILPVQGFCYILVSQVVIIKTLLWIELLLWEGTFQHSKTDIRVITD